MKLDIRIVATRRPELLEKTLRSFHDRMFTHFEIGSVHVNIDPAFGTVDEGVRTAAIAQKFFSAAQIHTPDVASFGAAVKRLWGVPSGNLIFHLEDDWLLHEDVTPSRVRSAMGTAYAAAVLLSKEHGHDGSRPFLFRTRTKKLFGFTFATKIVPGLGTSPKFLKPDFCQKISELMNPQLDPEKQMSSHRNQKLRDLIESKKCVVISSKDGGALIEDIGRQWREDRGIEKIVQHGKSTWTVSEN